MKVPLRYQVTRNDCGPTSMTNALSYLLEREEFPPDVLEYVYSVMLDKYRGADHPGGTSCWAMRFFGHWLNDTRRTTGLPIEAHQLRGEEVQIGDGMPFVECVEQGGVAVMSCLLGKTDHYVLVTGLIGIPKDGSRVSASSTPGMSRARRTSSPRASRRSTVALSRSTGTIPSPIIA